MTEKKYVCASLFPLFITLFGVLYGKYYQYGCYAKNHIEICENWNIKKVSVVEYQDTTFTIIPNCNCNKCVNSDWCNCAALKCYLIGEYDDGVECKIIRDYMLSNNYNHITSSNKIWNYDKLNQTFQPGENNDYYINHNKFSGLCFPIDDVEHIGDIVYGLFVVLIVSCSLLVPVLYVLCCGLITLSTN